MDDEEIDPYTLIDGILEAEETTIDERMWVR